MFHNLANCGPPSQPVNSLIILFLIPVQPREQGLSLYVRIFTTAPYLKIIVQYRLVANRVNENQIQPTFAHVY